MNGEQRQKAITHPLFSSHLQQSSSANSLRIWQAALSANAPDYGLGGKMGYDYAGDSDSTSENNIKSLKETCKEMRAYGVELRIRSQETVAHSKDLKLKSRKILRKKNGSQKMKSAA